MLEEMLSRRIKEAFGTESKMAFFVGAGISRPSNLPDFKELTGKVIELATDGNLKDEALVENIRPEVALQIAVETRKNTEVFQVFEELKGHNPNFYHFFLAETLRQGNWVFTTNYDELIEQACKNKEVRFEKCIRKEDYEEFMKRKLKEKPPTLFKLHGTIEDYNTIQASLRQVGRGLTKFKAKLLTHFLKNFDFCFIGYRSLDDFDIYPVLLETKTRKSVYWFTYGKGPIETVWDKRSKERLQAQIEDEKKKPPGSRNHEIINVNSFLLRRGNFLKLIGDPGKFIQEIRDTTFQPFTSIAKTEPIPFEEKALKFEGNAVILGHLGEAKIWFYHVSSRLYKDVAQYKLLKNTLFNFGDWYRDAFVVFLDKEMDPKIVRNLETVFELSHDDMPCLIISPTMLTADILSLLKENAKRATLLKRGIFTEYLLEKEERLVDFIMTLYETKGKKEAIDEFLESEKLEAYLKIAFRELRKHIKLPILP